MKEEIRKIRMRQKWLEIYAETGSVTKTALRCGIARSTLYRWINREKEQGKSELSDKSKRPSRLANIKMTPEIETIILNLRETRRWGAQRIANYLVRNYRNSIEFKKLLNFVGRFSYLAPYNAMPVQMQKPGATFVFNGKKWKEYGRRPKVNAQKLIILKPFGPVQCVFDYGDTEEISGALDVLDEADLMKLWDKSLKRTKGEIEKETWDILIKNLPVYGIYLDDKFQAANTYGGYIMPYEEKQLSIMVNKESARVNSRFIISVNKNQERIVQIHTICHELGHLFCYHQFYTESKRRKLTIKEREFEAETVAWLVCKRHGIYNPSEEYLASYAPQGEIPICSTDLIMKAVAEIERMMESPIKIKESLWYKEDKGLKEKIRVIERQQKGPDLFA